MLFAANLLATTEKQKQKPGETATKIDKKLGKQH